MANETQGYERGRIRTSVLLEPDLHAKVTAFAQAESDKLKSRVTASMVIADAAAVYVTAKTQKPAAKKR